LRSGRTRRCALVVGLFLVVSFGRAARGEETTPPATTTTLYPSLAAALAATVPAGTAVVAFGELHQRTATAHTRSTLGVFTREVLPALSSARFLVLETWVSTGQCGAEERAAVQEVEKTTERPKHVENELVTLIERARQLGVSPQVLSIDCAAYQQMRGGAGLDVEKTLQVTTDALEKKLMAVLDAGHAEPGRKLVVVYGGALHNDLYPSPDLARYSFGPAVYRRVEGAYVEIDLFLPPLIEASRRLLVTEPWFRAYRDVLRRAGRKPFAPGTVLRVARGPSSSVLIPLAGASR